MARRSSSNPEPQCAVLTIEQMRRGVARLKKRIEELQAFEPRSVQKRCAPEVEALSTAIEATLSSIFGPGTVEYNRCLLSGQDRRDRDGGGRLFLSRQDN